MKTGILKKKYICKTPQEAFDLGEKIGVSLRGGELILLAGGLGAGKTLLTKGIMHGVEFDVDEVTSPSFALVNLYKTKKFDVFHIDLWRLNVAADINSAVGLDEIFEDERAVVIIEWSEKLKKLPDSKQFFRIDINGDGDDARTIKISKNLKSGD